MSNSINEINQLITTSVISQTVGGGGGDADNGPTLIDGPISQIKIRHGKYIDSLQITYGLSEYHRLGGDGGDESTFKIEENQEIIGLEVWSGKRVDGLKFRIKDKQKGEFWSPFFGKEGGDKKYIDGQGYPLRKITGRFGRTVDQLTFHFGYLVKVENLDFDTQSIIDRLKSNNLKVTSFLFGDYQNPTNKEEERNTVKNFQGIETTTTTSFESISQFTIGHKVYGEATIKGIFKLGSEWSFEFKESISIGAVNSHTQKRFNEITHAFTAAPNATTSWEFRALSGIIEDATFTYDVVIYDPVTNQEIKRFKETGLINGEIMSTNYKFKKEVTPL